MSEDPIRPRLDWLDEADSAAAPCDALRAVLDALDDEDLRPGGNRTIPTDCIREEIAIGLGLMERER